MTFPIILSSVLSQGDVQRLTEIVDALLPKERTTGDMNSSDMQKALVAFGKSAQPLMEDAFRIFCDSRCLQAARILLRDEPVFVIPRCAFRYHEPGSAVSHLPFHVDGWFMGHDAPTLNFWIPLNDVGVTAPGLTYLRPEIDPEPFLKAWFTNIATRSEKTFTAEDFETIYGRPADEVLFTPVLSAGSVSVFHHATPHATQRLPNGGDYRLSIEMRVGRRSGLPDNFKATACPIAIPRLGANGWEFDYASARTPDEVKATPLAS